MKPREGAIQIFKSIDALKASVIGDDGCPSKREPDAVVQQSLPAPLLVHSRRCKLHALLLVASTSPLTAYFYEGLITLSSPDARVDITGDGEGAVRDLSTLACEKPQMCANGKRDPCDGA